MINLQEAFKTIFNVMKMETEHEYAIKQHIEKEKAIKTQLQDQGEQISLLIKERDYFRKQIQGMVEANDKANETMYIQRTSFFNSMGKMQRELAET